MRPSGNTPDRLAPRCALLDELTEFRRDGLEGLRRTEVGTAADVAREVVRIRGVASVENVTGSYDMTVPALRNLDGLHELPAERQLDPVRLAALEPAGGLPRAAAEHADGALPVALDHGLVGRV